MAIIDVTIRDHIQFGGDSETGIRYPVDSGDTYRIRQYNYGATSPMTFTFENLNDDSVAPLSGTVTFTVGKEAGENNTIDLSSEVVKVINSRPAFFDITFSGVPSTAKILFHVR